MSDDFATEHPPPTGTAGPPKLDEHGLHHGGLSARWDQVFGALRIEDRVYVLMARKPPAPPWIELPARALGELSLDGLVDAIQSRVRAIGYRDHAGARPRLELGELRQRILRGERLPGALEVPIGPGPHGRMHKGVGWAFVVTSAAVLGTSVGLAAGAITLGVGGLPMLLKKKPKVGGRVLVLAPDGCVIGLPMGPEAFAWPSIGRFAEGESQRGGRSFPCLQIEGRDGEIIGKLDASWFQGPLPIIIGVAEAYRTRQRH